MIAASATRKLKQNNQDWPAGLRDDEFSAITSAENARSWTTRAALMLVRLRTHNTTALAFVLERYCFSLLL